MNNKSKTKGPISTFEGVKISEGNVYTGAQITCLNVTDTTATTTVRMHTSRPSNRSANGVINNRLQKKNKIEWTLETHRELNKTDNEAPHIVSSIKEDSELGENIKEKEYNHSVRNIKSVETEDSSNLTSTEYKRIVSSFAT